MLCVILTACAAQTPIPPTHPENAEISGQNDQDSRILGQNDEFVVIVASKGETYTRLASRFLEDEKESWRIEEANNNAQLIAGMEVVVPKTDLNRIGVYSNGYQVIPILAYHRFGKGRGRLSVSGEQLTQQMEFLKQHGYQVIPLQDLVDFLHAKKAIPKRSVVLTIDDGYKSTYEIAFPILSKYGFPATIFIYSDYIGKGGLNWRQMIKMEASGLISFQAHSKSHANLTISSKIEPIEQYQNRLNDEVRIPENQLKKRMDSNVFSFAYPFGAVNRMVVDELKKEGYELAATVFRGANPFFANPYLLRRTMIYEADGMAEFEQALQTFESKTLR